MNLQVMQPPPFHYGFFQMEGFFLHSTPFLHDCSPHIFCLVLFLVNAACVHYIIIMHPPPFPISTNVMNLKINRYQTVMKLWMQQGFERLKNGTRNCCYGLRNGHKNAHIYFQTQNSTVSLHVPQTSRKAGFETKHTADGEMMQGRLLAQLTLTEPQRSIPLG